MIRSRECLMGGPDESVTGELMLNSEFCISRRELGSTEKSQLQ
jgi:hypothetical protein